MKLHMTTNKFEQPLFLFICLKYTTPIVSNIASSIVEFSVFAK